MKNIVLVLSDQHSYRFTSWNDNKIDTPNIDRIRNKSMSFDRCYCNAPLCVPSRMSFLSGKFPSELKIFNNDTTLPIDLPTIAHFVGSLGYKTALIGRMHFKGDDQKHGFDIKLGQDITSQYWGTGGKNRTDFADFAGTTNRKNCLNQVGGGVSPTMCYDKEIYDIAINFLHNYDDSKNPLFLIVGFYSPHFPFTCSENLYHKYKIRYPLYDCEEEQKIDSLPIYEDYMQDCQVEHMRNCKAAYAGMVEQLDTYIGGIYDEYQNMNSEREKLFCYTSDHGEQLGKRNIFGKQTMYEDAIRVPCIIQGNNFSVGSNDKTVSLLDLSYTLMQEAGCEDLSWHSGKSLHDRNNNPVRIQQIVEYKNHYEIVEALIVDNYKIIKTQNKFVVYDVSNNYESIIENTNNILKQIEKNIGELKNYFLSDKDKNKIIKNEEQQKFNHDILKKWGQIKKPDEWATMHMNKDRLISSKE